MEAENPSAFKKLVMLANVRSKPRHTTTGAVQYNYVNCRGDAIDMTHVALHQHTPVTEVERELEIAVAPVSLVGISSA